MNINATTPFIDEASTMGPAPAALENAHVLPMESAKPLSLTPRDINAHLARTLEHYDALTAQFAQNKLAIDSELVTLKQTGGEASCVNKPRG